MWSYGTHWRIYVVFDVIRCIYQLCVGDYSLFEIRRVEPLLRLWRPRWWRPNFILIWLWRLYGLFEGIQAISIDHSDLILRTPLHNYVQVFQRLFVVSESYIAPWSLVECEWWLLDAVSICEGFCCIVIGSCCHQEVSCINVNHWIFLKV